MEDFSEAGMMPTSMHLFQNVESASASVVLHFFSRIAGIPSGPDAAFSLSSSFASMISSGVIAMLFMACVLSSISGGSVDGLLKTELYWFTRISAISVLLLVISLVSFLRRGPIFCLNFAFPFSMAEEILGILFDCIYCLFS